MSNYIISDECRHYLDAIIPTFSFPNKVNDIRGEIESVVKLENGDFSYDNIVRLYLLIKDFLSKHGFGHDEDYVYIINKKGMDLKKCGSLAAYEEMERIKKTS